MLREGNTLLSILDQGETQADVVASRAGVQTGFNTVGVRYTYRMKYKVITNSSTGDGYYAFRVDETTWPLLESGTVFGGLLKSE